MTLRRLVLFIAAGAGCSLVTPLDGYSGGEKTVDGGGPVDAHVDGALDAGVDAEAGADPLDDGLLAKWSFEEGSGTIAKDGTGRGNDGVLENGVARAPGRIGGALQFDGVDDDVKVAESPSIVATSTMSVTFWLKVAAGNIAASPRMITHVDSWNVKLNGPYAQLTSGGGYAISGTKIIADEWHHVGVVFQSGVVTIYVDGVAGTLSTNTYKGGETLGPSTAGLYLGTYSTTEAHLQGQLDEVRLYGRALSAAEMAKLATP